MEANKVVKIELNTEELTPAQVRLIRSINSLLTHVATTEDECEFFDGSAELMRALASMIQQANFNNSAQTNRINYADQAVEFSIDTVNEALKMRKVISYDN